MVTTPDVQGSRTCCAAIDKGERHLPGRSRPLDGAAWDRIQKAGTVNVRGPPPNPATATVPGVTVSEQGGDPACWLSQVCPNCGRLNGCSADGARPALPTSGAAATEEDTR